jgi:VanZ family protein
MPLQKLILKKYRIRSVCRILAWLWTLTILYLFIASQTSLPAIKIRGIGDWFHFLSMMGFCFLWLCGYYSGRKKQLVFVWLISFCFGVAVEIVQYYFTETRGFQIKDIVFDTLGATTGLLLFRYGIMRILRSRP